MSTFTPSGSGGAVIPVVDGSSPTNPAITNISLTLASTEVTIALPTECKRFLIKLRGFSPLQLSYVSGQSGTIYLTMPAGSFYAEDSVNPTGKFLYVQSPVAGEVVELVTWT